MTTENMTGSQTAAERIRSVGQDVKDHASETAKKSAETLKSRAGDMMDQTKEFASDAAEKLSSGFNEQKTVGADYLHNIADIVRRSASGFDHDVPQAGHYIRKAASQLDSVSEAIRNRDASEIIGNVRDFAKQRPAAFFGAALLVGFAAVRFFKSGVESGTASAESEA